MSKIAKQKANQWILKHKDGDVLYVQDAYIAAYDQALQDSQDLQDFLEKACDYLQKNLWRVVIEDGEFRQRFVTDFKNYMKEGI